MAPSHFRGERLSLLTATSREFARPRAPPPVGAPIHFRVERRSIMTATSREFVRARVPAQVGAPSRLSFARPNRHHRLLSGNFRAGLGGLAAPASDHPAPAHPRVQ